MKKVVAALFCLTLVACAHHNKSRGVASRIIENRSGDKIDCDKEIGAEGGPNGEWDMLDCNFSKADDADIELNQVWAQLKAKLPHDKFIPLRTEQRAWLQSHKEKCENSALADSEEGSGIYQGVYSGCIADELSARVAYLKSLL